MRWIDKFNAKDTLPTMLLMKVAQHFSDMGSDGKLYIIGCKLNHKTNECEIEYTNLESEYEEACNYE